MPDDTLRKEHWFSRLCNHALLWIACVVCGVILLLNILYRVWIDQSSAEQVLILPGLGRSVCFLVLTAVLVLTAGYLPVGKKLSERGCFLALSLVYIVMAGYLMRNADSAISQDSGLVRSAAVHFLNGDYSDLELGGYISNYPHQAGLMVYDALIYSISQSLNAPVIANLCFVLGIQYLLWKTADTLFHSRTVNLVTMGLSFAFVPQFCFILFIYGTIPGLFFLMLAFYQGLRFSQEDGVWRLLVAALSSGIAVLLRKNDIIGVVALGVFLFLRGLESRKMGRFFSAACLVLICAVLPNQLLLAALEAKTGEDLHWGTPNILYIGMGTDIDNHFFGPGWWDGTNVEIFCEKAFCEQDVAQQLGQQRFRMNLSKIKHNPGKALKFFWEKAASTWCDPLYQSVWSGPKEDQGQFTHTPFLQSIYGGGRGLYWLEIFCEWLSLALWCFAVLFLLVFRQNAPQWRLFYLYTIGGVLFHLIWETKSQYVYPYVFCLIPFAAFGLVRSVQWTAQYRRSRGRLTGKPAKEP